MIKYFVLEEIARSQFAYGVDDIAICLDTE